ncbi:MAG: alpha-2-macroglobulin domain protein, partial [Chloroflexi bacterium]|nr:alpha-2-macroglobulin domain protein [Chloroflexota bacterium]
MRLSFRRPPMLRLLPLLVLPALLGGSFVPNTVRSGLAASPTLSVRAVSPSPDAIEATQATTILVAFDRPVAPLTGVGETPTPSPLTSSPALSGSGRWVTSSIYAWHAVNLHAATVYSLRIPAGLKAIDGTKLQSSYSWHFATVRPALLNTSPSDGYLYAMPRPAISMSFNQRMDHASTEAAFHLRDSQGNDLPGIFSWSSGVLRFKPVQTLSRTASYTAELGSGARSAEGPLPLLRPITWHFSVAPYLHVAGSTPKQGDTAANLDNGIEIDFNAPVVEASAIPSVRISPDVPGRYISMGQDNLSIHIWGNFSPSTAYTITLKAGLRAAAGEQLGASYALHFVSAPLPPQLYFVTGNVATYDAYRPVVLSLQAVNPGPITYTIYKLSRDGFLTDLNDQYNLAHDVPSNGTPLLTFTKQPFAPLNSPVPVQIQLSLPGNRPLPVGYYLVRAAGAGQSVDYQILLVTRTGVTVKVSQRQLLVWATDLKTGLPVAGVPFRFVTGRSDFAVPYNSGPTNRSPKTIGGNTVIGSGNTGSDGTLLLNVPGIVATQSLVDAGVLALGDRPGDAIVASSSWSNGISPYDYGISLASSQPARRINLYTDRPIYRPSQTVHVRGVVRADNDGHYTVVSGPVYLVLTDPKGQVAARRTVMLDRFGAFSTDISLAGNASLGSYGLSASSGSQTSYSSLQVAEYKNPTFSVAITTPHATYALGQSIPATVAVSYYFGGAVAHAKVHWSVLGYDYIFYSDFFSDYSFGSFDPGIQQPLAAARPAFLPLGKGVLPPGVGGYTLFQGNAITDANGIVHLKLPAKLPSGKLVQNYSVEASVTDLDNQPVSGRTSVTVYSSDFQIGLQPDHQIIDPLVAQQIHVVTVANDGVRPVGGQSVRVAIYRRVFHNVVTHNRDGSINQLYVPQDTFIESTTVRTNQQGKASIRFAAPRGGEYHIVASARDKFGNKTESSVEIYAGGQKPIDWGFQQQGHIRVVTDKRTYHSGDVAHVLVTTPYPNMLALVSIERGHILQYQVRRLT